MTFFCILITGLILVTLTCISLYIAESGTKRSSYPSFRSNISSTLNHMENQSMLTHSWIAGQSASYGFLMNICDNNTPFLFNSLNKETSLQDNFQLATQISKENYGLDITASSPKNNLSQYVTFAFTDSNGANYYAATALLPKGEGYLSVIILYPLAIEQQAALQQRTLFAISCLIALLFLSIFSWFFTKLMLKPIQESRQRQTQFIASASHELRSPLTVILSSLSALRIAKKEDVEGFANTIQAEGKRMSRLINDMLILANTDNGTWNITARPVELDSLLMQTYEKYEHLAKTKDLKLRLELPKINLSPLSLDEERIAQVLSILIDNAFSYTSAGGTVILSLESISGKQKLSVIDNGPGISDKEKTLIFERFYRADKAHHSKTHFGLGLCIAAEIVKLHKGKLLVTDTLDGGATFQIILSEK